MWFEEQVSPEEVMFEADVFLLRKEVARSFHGEGSPASTPASETPVGHVPTRALPGAPQAVPGSASGAPTHTLRLVGNIPPEIWNRVGTKIIPKLRAGSDLRIGMELTATVRAESAESLVAEIRQILQELGLAEVLRIEQQSPP